MTWLAGIGAAAVRLSPVGAFFRSVPRWAWLALAVVLAFGGLAWWHFDAVGDARKAGYIQGTADTEKRIERKALALKAKADALTGRISRQLKERNDAENRAIAGRADDQRLRGPGQSRCTAGPGLPGAASGSGATGGKPDAARPGLPVEERAAVPWGWLVSRAEQCDLNRAEVLTWRDWYANQVDAWKTIAGDAK